LEASARTEESLFAAAAAMHASNSTMKSRPTTAAFSSTTTQSQNISYEDSYSAMIYGDNPRQTTNEGCLPKLLCCGGGGCTNNHNNSCANGIFGCYIRPQPKWLLQLYATTRSSVWIVLVIGFTFLLLFGPAVQSLVDTDKAGDAIFLWFRVAMLAFFLLEILIRCLAEENYFVMSLNCACRPANPNLRRISSVLATNNNTPMTDSKHQQLERRFRFGSFLFWCDLISALSILYDLSFINNHHFETVTREIQLVGGIPDREESYRLAPNSLELNLLIVILRTARCARFVQSRALVNASNKLNMNVRSSLIHSIFCSYFRSRREEQQKQSSRMSQFTNAMESMIRESTVLVDDPSRVPTQNVSRHDAAIKIQRIWRKRTEIVSADDWEPPQRNASASSSIRSQSLVGRASSMFASFSFTASRNQQKQSVSNPRSILEAFAENNELDTSDAFTPQSILEAFAEKTDPESERTAEDTPKSKFQSKDGKNHNESQVGSDMRQKMAQRVATGTFLILLCTILFTYIEASTIDIKTMVVLHTQTKIPEYTNRSLNAAVCSSVPMLYEYYPVGATEPYYPNPHIRANDINKLSDRNILNITIIDGIGKTKSNGLFDNSQSIKNEAMVEIIATFFVILFWFAGLICFSGPVAMLVIAPVEQMVRLLGMLSRDPLGYQSTPAYKQFLKDEDKMTQNTGWSKEILRGMETSFLKSTILRIGSLMKVGFGSAGVQIIQNNLETGGQSQNLLTLNAQGTTVSCIFLFCDIRQFTDATEQLQEEVFVFTNRIAAVVHSYCNSYGGAANKNVGDAFLISWSLDEKGRSSENRPLRAKNSQADKALLSVIKICIALAYDHYFLEPLSNAAIVRLKTKLGNRSGPVVQIGFGLHAGKAVQGAIGSQRKIDASYVAESVELAETLESSTKRYGLKVLMSGEFNKLLYKRNRDRCRKIDQLLISDHEDDDLDAEIMNLFTFDMDVDALQQRPSEVIDTGETGTIPKDGKKRKQNIRKRRTSKGSGKKSNTSSNADRSKKSDNGNRTSSTSFLEFASNLDKNDYHKPSELSLPNGPMLYSHNVWFSPEMKRLRQKFVQGEFFFEYYKEGLEAYYRKDWREAKRYFRYVWENFEDGPSKYFLAQIEKHKGKPPKDFKAYGTA